jgi:pyruvate,water dikinase
VLRRDRLEGLADADVVARHPTVLALLPPRIGPPRPLPARAEATDRPPDPTDAGPDEDPMAVAREALRLRVRWVQELGARTALALGGRLADRGQLAEAEAVRDLHLDEVVALVEHPERRVGVPPHEEEAPPLPAVFRLSEEGDVVADHHGGGGPHGVSAGRARAPVTHDPAAAAGRVLVVRNLDPALAPALGALAALVAETGSPLSHLAILAREHHVPTVVGYVDAVDLLAEGEVVVVDGSAGTVERDGRDAGDGGDGP